jgi:hypothetical protein
MNSLRPLFLMGLLAAVGACYQPTYADCIECGNGNSCPPGLMCDQGRCSRSPGMCPSEGGAGSDASDGGDVTTAEVGQTDDSGSNSDATDGVIDGDADGGEGGVDAGADGDSDGDAGDASSPDAFADSSSDGGVDAPVDGEISHPDGGADGPRDGPDGPGSFVTSSGLALWLRGSEPFDLDDDQKPVWRDLSAHRHTARIVGPVPVPLVGLDGISGQPAFRFANPDASPQTRLIIADSPALRWGRDDFLVAAAFRTTRPTNQNIFVKQQTEEPWVGVGLVLYAGGQPVGSISLFQILDDVQTNHLDDGQPHAVLVGRTGNQIWLRADGVLLNLQTYLDRQDVSNAGIDLVIGNAMAVDSNPFAGDLAEIIALSGSAVATYLDEVEGYLKTRYQIP